jgi:hypothetical protein
MKVRVFLLFLWVSYTSLAQQKLAKEVSFVNDNDLFISTFKDRYYTNGLFLTYRHLRTHNNSELEKKIMTWQIGHLMFTPHKSTVEDITEHDRPFAAYLYASAGINNVYKNQQMLQFEMQLGVLGPAALGENLQNFIHDIYGFDRPAGWKHQIKNALGINLNASYIKRLAIDEDERNDVSFVSTLRVGTVFTDVATGIHGRLGFNTLQKISNSIAFNTNLNNEHTSGVRGIESMLYYKAMLGYTHYDATIQGSFLNTSSPVTYQINPVRFNFELGLLFTIQKMNVGYSYHFYSNKLKNLRYPDGNSFGKIRINYTFN